MANQGKPAKPGDAAKSKADQPAFDTEAPLLFKGGK
jgi:hypothetical protein